MEDFSNASLESQKCVIVKAFDARQTMLRSLALRAPTMLIAISDVLLRTIDAGGKIVVFGNGGSAADAQHIVAEFVGRFNTNRRPLPALALGADTAVLTCIGNDFGYDAVYARQVEALVENRDVVAALSTSGTSKNVLSALAVAKKKGAVRLGFTGDNGGKMKDIVDYCLCIPSRDTALVQEGYLAVWHILCGMIEASLNNPRVFDQDRLNGV